MGLVVSLTAAAGFRAGNTVNARVATPFVSQTVVIYQIYGAGGNRTSSDFTHDYVALYNRGSEPVSLNGWSTQYASSGGSNWYVTPLTNVTLQPGQYYLIQYAGGSNGGGVPVPNPDIIAPQVPQGFIPNLNETSGKLALVNSTVALPQSTCPTDVSIVDLVGYGDAASCSEGAATVNLNSTSALFRKGDGCDESDNNFNDFELGAPAPRNTASPTSACETGGVLAANGNAEPNVVLPGTHTLIRITVFPATTPKSTGVAVTGDFTQIGGSATQQLFDNGTNGDEQSGDNIYSYLAGIPVNATGGAKLIPVSATDQQGREAGLTITVTVNAPFADEDPLLLGNPTNATTEIANENNYLMFKAQYSLSYSRAKATANWVAWRLDSTWIGSVSRQDDYRPDPALPFGWYQVGGSDYSGSGYDRGHMCPSGDRTNTVENNSATFLMTNMIPQLSENNQGPWADFENYLRAVAGQGNELYIFSGGFGNAGTIANGQVVVPLVTWKVVLVLPNGDNDLNRVNKSTRTIAILVPNQPPVNQGADWRVFRKTVDQIEAVTGFDFFSNVPKITQEIIERRRDLQ